MTDLAPERAARRVSVRLGISAERFRAIFGDVKPERGRVVYTSEKEAQSRQRAAEAARQARAAWEAVFGPPKPVRRGLYRIAADGALRHWSDFTPEDRTAWERRQRTKSTRVGIVRDIDPFMTGRTEAGRYIGGRAQKRDFMRETGLVEHDDSIREAPAEWTPDEDEIAQAIKRAWETDPAEIIPKERAREAAERDAWGVGLDIEDAEIVA